MTTQHARMIKLGWDDDLVVESRDEPAPEPSGSRVRVDVEACGVCYRDLVDREGRFKFIQLPITPGHEVVGRVAAVGPDVSDWKVGDRVASMHRDYCGDCRACRMGETSLCATAVEVMGLVIDGGYASHVTASERCFFRVPNALDAAEAAVLHCTFGTAYRGLKRFGEVQEGQRVLVTGANGGVGTAATQVATRLGASVVAVTRDEAQREFLTELGASEVLVDPGDAFHKQLASPVDVVMDCVGPPTFNASMRSLLAAGRLIVVGNVVKERVAVNLGYVVLRSLRITGSSGANRRDMQELLQLHDEQPFQVPIDARLPISKADEAQRRVRAGGLRGRIVLTTA